jgi:muconate cycloisomerase
MKISRFEVLVVEIPMRIAVKHALAERETARNVIVAARDDGGAVGWGESCPRSYVTGETIESVQRTLPAEFFPRLQGRSFESFDDVAAELGRILDGIGAREQAAFCGVELAVLDLAGKLFGVSAGSVLGSVRSPEVRYSGVIATEDPGAAERYARFMHEFETGAVKVKLGASLDENRKLLEIARRILGDDVSLRVDANCAWSADEAIHQLESLAEFRLDGVEQPVPAEDLAGMSAVTAAGLVPVVADESLCSIRDAEELIRERGCNVFNVRISKNGGLINAGRLHDLAEQAGLRCQLGAQVGETGILSAAGRHFATRREGLLWFEGSYGELLLETDITEPSVTVGRGGCAPALTTPGLGVEPLPAQLERFTTERISLV